MREKLVPRAVGTLVISAIAAFSLHLVPHVYNPPPLAYSGPDEARPAVYRAVSFESALEVPAMGERGLRRVRFKSVMAAVLGKKAEEPRAGKRGNLLGLASNGIKAGEG